MTLDVLIVDDSATMRALIKKTLSLSFPSLNNVYEAADGIAALVTLGDHDVDVVFMDINMPRMDGLQLAGRMKRDPKLADVPVIVVSTEGSAERLDELQSYGIAGYLRKPFRPEELKQSVNQVLELSDDRCTEDSVGCDF